MKDLRITTRPPTECEEFSVWVIQNQPTRKCNLDKRQGCDFYLSSSAYKKFHTGESFDDIPYEYGLAVEIKSDKDKVLRILKSIKWEDYGQPSMDGAIKLAKSDIIKAYQEHR